MVEGFVNFPWMLFVDLGIVSAALLLATLLRARFCNPRIQSICKVDGLAFKVSDIIAGIDQYVAVSA